MWGYLKYHGDVQYCGGYNGGYFVYCGGVQYCGDVQYCGGYPEYCGGYSVLWGNHDARGDIMSTVWGFNTVGDNLLLFKYPTVLNTPTVLMISPTLLKLQRMVSSHGTEHPHSTHDISTTVLSIPQDTQDNPPQYSQYPHGTEHLLWYSRYPHIYHESPTVLNIAHSSQDIPTCIMNIPHSTEYPHGTAQTLYRVICFLPPS